MIDVKFSEEQFKTLLEMVFLGNWISNAHRREPIKRYRELEEFLFELCPQFGLVGYSDGDTPKYPSKLFIKSLMGLIKENEEVTFWEQFIERFSTLQIHRDYTQEQLENMEQTELFDLIKEYEDNLRAYLSKNGLSLFQLPE